MRSVVSLVLILLLSACASRAPKDPPLPWPDLPASGAKIPGPIGLYVDASATKGDFQPTRGCGLEPVASDARAAFSSAAKQTLERYADSVVVVDQPMTPDEAAGRGMRGIASLKVEEFSPLMVTVAGFSLSLIAVTGADLEMIYGDPAGRSLTESTRVTGSVREGLTAHCANAEEILAHSTDALIDQAMRRFATGFMNSALARTAGSNP